MLHSGKQCRVDYVKNLSKYAMSMESLDVLYKTNTSSMSMVKY